MLGWAVTFLVIALIAGVLGFGGIAGTSAGIAQILFFVFLVLFVISLIGHVCHHYTVAAVRAKQTLHAARNDAITRAAIRARPRST